MLLPLVLVEEEEDTSVVSQINVMVAKVTVVHHMYLEVQMT